MLIIHIDDNTHLYILEGLNAIIFPFTTYMAQAKRVYFPSLMKNPSTSWRWDVFLSVQYIEKIF